MTHGREFGLRKGAEEFPLMVTVAVTLACNSRCPSCPYTQDKSIRIKYKDNLLINTGTLLSIARQCGEHKAYLRLTGGEPLLHPAALPAIERAKECGARVGIITNGSLINGNTADRLLRANTDAIEVSVDAADRETYSRLRVGLDFDKMLANVLYLVKRREFLGSSSKLIASIVDQQGISGKLEETVNFWKNIVDEVQVRKYLTWGVMENKAEDATPLMQERVPCPIPFERVIVNTEGRVVLCNYDIKGETDFGNAAEETVSEIWRGKKLEAVREMLLTGHFEKVALCSHCEDWRYRSWDYNYWSVLNKAERNREAAQ